MAFKQDLFTQLARIGQALGSGTRLELIEFLAQGERSVDALAKAAGLSLANASHHLQQLRRAGLVVNRKEGLYVYYRLSGEDVVVLLASVRHVGQRHLAEVDQLVQTFLTVKDALEPVSREELRERVRQRIVTVLDVRPPEEYASGHLPGAINVPLAEIEKHLGQFDPRQEIIAYCRGPHCILAFEAVSRLRGHGLQSRRLEDGYPEWQSAGLPVETGSR
ncbi:MAG: metalloregulator ArsR/SmtB family transcription factor [Gammaproteobacteria bacterium]|nr:metalloregulator ArsR/SmtB family transcription factor [Gammaproteobacteria bacterium]